MGTIGTMPRMLTQVVQLTAPTNQVVQPLFDPPDGIQLVMLAT